MSSSSNQSNKDETTKLENSTYNILMALGKEADFLYSTIDTIIQDAEKDGRSHLVDLWNDEKRQTKTLEYAKTGFGKRSKRRKDKPIIH